MLPTKRAVVLLLSEAEVSTGCMRALELREERVVYGGMDCQLFCKAG